MALYDGFFDAYQDEDTGEYDRAYDSAQFTQYFGQIIGSGVCVYNNPDSYKVRLEGENAVVSPGYLFIRGYWLSNQPGDDESAETYAGYTVPLSGTGKLAIVARLNLAQKMIEIEAQPAAQSYTDCLVLAYIDMASGTVQDTRYDTEICGVIDAAGSVSSKIIWATDYINNEVQAKLEQARADINAQSATLDSYINQVNSAIDRIVTPPIGTIKFSAAQTVESGWLRCDGSFISEANYSELVAALGKINPGISDFTEIAGGAVARDISNGVLHNGRFWVFSNSAKKLYGISTEGQPAVEISVTGTDKLSTTVANTYPIFLSIIDSSIFLCQRFNTAKIMNMVIYANYSFLEDGSGIEMSQVELPEDLERGARTALYKTALYVTKDANGYFNAASAYYGIGYRSATDEGYCQVEYYKWETGSYKASNIGTIIPTTKRYSYTKITTGLLFEAVGLLGFNKKNENEMVWFADFGSFQYINSPDSISGGKLKSALNGTYSLDIAATYYQDSNITVDYALDTMSIVGGSDFMIKYSVKPGAFTVKFIKAYDNAVNMRYADKTVSLSAVTSQAKVFPDACIYIPDRLLWLFFVGTGIVFTTDLNDASRYGFLDTRSTLGTISKYGYLEYDAENDSIIAAGQDTGNAVRVASLKLYGVEDYAAGGTFLPTISRDGIPAYIKAKAVN